MNRFTKYVSSQFKNPRGFGGVIISIIQNVLNRASVADDMGKLPVEVSLCIQTANAKNPEDDLFETTVEVTSLSEKNNPIKDDNSLTGKNDSVPQSSNMRGIVAGIAAVSLILLLFYVLATYRRQQLRRRRKKRHTKRHDR